MVSLRNQIFSIFGGLIAGTLTALAFNHFGMNGSALSGVVVSLFIGVGTAINTKLELVALSSAT